MIFAKQIWGIARTALDISQRKPTVFTQALGMNEVHSALISKEDFFAIAITTLLFL